LLSPHGVWMGVGGSKHLLHEAASSGDLHRVCQLLEDGEDCNERDKVRVGVTALVSYAALLSPGQSRPALQTVTV
jgi:hypothetical protein